MAEIIRKCDMISSGASHKILKNRLLEEKIDYSHIKLGLNSNKGRKFNKDKIPLTKILVQNSTYNRTSLKRRLISELNWENKCILCGNTGDWLGKPLTLQLDHINGISNDNRIENLRILCPNCHSQTPTYSGKKLTKNKCSICSRKTTNRKTKYCRPCFIKHINPEIAKSQRKSDRPDIQVLLNDVKQMGYVKTGKKYGVSDNAIRKWLNTPYR